MEPKSDSKRNKSQPPQSQFKSDNILTTGVLTEQTEQSVILETETPKNHGQDKFAILSQFVKRQKKTGDGPR